MNDKDLVHFLFPMWSISLYHEVSVQHFPKEKFYKIINTGTKNRAGFWTILLFISSVHHNMI